MQPRSPESDPGLEAALEIEKQHERENQQRAEIAQIMESKSVPTFEQLERAQQWAENIRENGRFDDDGKLIQEGGLSPVTEDMVAHAESYFDDDNWLLGEEEKKLAISLFAGRIEGEFRVVQDHKLHKTQGVYDSHWDKSQLIKKYLPELGESLSLPQLVNGERQQPRGFTTLELMDKFATITKDAKAMVDLDTAIRKAYEDGGVTRTNTDTDRAALRYRRVHSIDRRNRQEKVGDTPTGDLLDKRFLGKISGKNKALARNLFHVDVDRAIAAIEAAASRGDRLDYEHESGLNLDQKNALLTYFGYKTIPEAPVVNPKTLRPDITRKERGRRLINGSQRKPAVAARHKLENASKLAQMKLKADDALDDGHRDKLSARKRARLEGKITRSAKKIESGSIISSVKYGEGATRESTTDAATLYSRSNLVGALEQLKELRNAEQNKRDELRNGENYITYKLLSEKLQAAVERENTTLPEQAATDPNIELNAEVFDQVMQDIEKNFDDMMAKRVTELPAGERLKDHEIDSMYIDSQLAVARELADLDFDKRGIPKEGTQYTSRVRQLVEAFHSYRPVIEKSITFTREVVSEIGEEITKAIAEDVRNYKATQNQSLKERLSRETFVAIRNKAIERVSKTELARRFGLSDPVKLEAAVALLEAELEKLRQAKK